MFIAFQSYGVLDRMCRGLTTYYLLYNVQKLKYMYIYFVIKVIPTGFEKLNISY